MSGQVLGCNCSLELLCGIWQGREGPAPFHSQLGLQTCKIEDGALAEPSERPRGMNAVSAFLGDIALI